MISFVLSYLVTAATTLSVLQTSPLLPAIAVTTLSKDIEGNFFFGGGGGKNKWILSILFIRERESILKAIRGDNIKSVIKYLIELYLAVFYKKFLTNVIVEFVVLIILCLAPFQLTLLV